MADLQSETARRLLLAGFTPDDPAIAFIAAWNAKMRELRPLPPYEKHRTD